MKKIKAEKLKIIEATDNFYIPHTYGRDFISKGDIIMYKVKKGSMIK